MWIERAIRSGWFEIECGAYEDQVRGTVCPIVAGAIMAGIWRDGQLLPDSMPWGTPARPSAEVEEFAAYFDLCAEQRGTGAAIEIVAETLGVDPFRARHALGPAA